MHMRAMFSPKELASAELRAPFNFTKGCPVLKIEAQERRVNTTSYGSALYDLSAKNDENEIQKHTEMVGEFCKKIAQVMREHDAPEELFQRFGFYG